MQFLTSLIGGSANLYINSALALGVVLVLIVLLLWLLKLLFRASSGVVRGRNKRLAVIDSLPVDGKRQLIIIRRDNVEHLILTGGPQDLLVESGFPPEEPLAATRPVPALRRQAAAVVGPQRAPAPKRAAAAVEVTPPPPAPTPLPASEQEPVRASLERLRDFGRPPVQRRPASIRHTGLMRSVGRMEPPLIPANTDNSAPPETDSATTVRSGPFGLEDDDGQDFGRNSTPETQRDKQR